MNNSIQGDEVFYCASEVWNAESLMLAASGEWLVKPESNWVIDTFCIEEKFFQFGDMVFISSANTRNLKSCLERYVLNGASGFIVDGTVDFHPPRPTLVVRNVKHSLESMARFHRNRLKAKVVAITGSVGKSSTREILSKLLAHQYKTYRTQANYNLYAGVQLSIINTPSDADFAVYEMAIGAPGSIQKSSNLAKPDVVVLTKMSKAHLQRHLTLNNIVCEKLKILSGLDHTGLVVYPSETETTALIEEKLHVFGYHNNVTFGKCEEDYCRLITTEIIDTAQALAFVIGKENFSTLINLSGEHNALNAVAAISALPYLCVNVDRALPALSKLEPVKGRMEHHVLNVDRGSYILIDDSFNANPASMEAAITYIDSIKHASNGRIKRTICVMSDMLELGKESKKSHIKLSEQINASCIDILIFVGKEIEETYKNIERNINKRFKCSVRAAQEYLKTIVKDGDVVLIKGSHSTGVSEICKSLIKTSSIGERSSESEKCVAPKNRSSNQCLNPTAGAIMDLVTGEVYSTISCERIVYPAALTKIFGLCFIYEKIIQDPNQLNQSVRISDKAASIPSKWVLESGELVKVRDLISAVAVSSSNEAMVALSEWHSGTERGFALDLTRYANGLGLRKSKFRNSTGLFNEGHITCLFDILSIIKHAKIKFPELCKEFSRTSFTFRGEKYKNTNDLLGVKGIDGFKTGRTPKSGFNIAITSNKNGRQVAVVVVGCSDKKNRNSFALDLLDNSIHRVVKYTTTFIKKCSSKKTLCIKSKKNVASISVLGDTYFGEYYDRDREKRRQKNYLDKYGYQHSFRFLSKFLTENDLNLANFEAALTHHKKSPLIGIKNWILDADPESSIDVLKNYNIDGVMLGNNHSSDFGNKALVESFDLWKNAGIPYIGAGHNSEESLDPLEIDLEIADLSKKIFIISGYAYNKHEDNQFGIYSSENKAGVCNITSASVIERIKSIKSEYPESFLLVSPHWGVNYKWATDNQKKWAKNYVDAGADLIVGHGAHMTQQIEVLSGKLVIYSLGNFIFNSNGEYRKRNVPPYSLLFRMLFKNIGSQIIVDYQLYPFFCANHECGFQPKPCSIYDSEMLRDLLGYKLRCFEF